MTAKNQNWLSIEEAAAFLGFGKTVLYSLAREGRIPARKVGKKWLFQGSELNAWVDASSSPDTMFTNLDFNISENDALRVPQREAYERARDFFDSGKNNAIIQIPVGCGKSGVASLLPLGLSEGRALLIAPNLTIKDGLYDAVDVTNRQKCFWRKTGVLKPEQMVAGPYACTLDTANISVAEKSHVVVTNVQQLATNTDKWLNKFSDDFFGMIVVDEAHHSAATSWKTVIDKFPKAKVALLTATPFRSDQQQLDGELIYRYSFRSATLKGYIKRLKASYVAPSQIELQFADERGKTYDLNEVLALKEETWFSRGVALARPCNMHIVDSSLQKLDELRQSGSQHQLIAVACSINHAREIRSLYEERGYSAAVIHSNQKPDEQADVLSRLKSGALDCIIQVQMLGEGFDHPKLSVAAIFRPFRSLAPYIQFVGRIMRVVVQNSPNHPDNIGHIVTHLGMNLDARLKEFKQFEADDDAFWDSVIGGDEPIVSKEVQAGEARKTVGEKIVVKGEVVDALWEEDFTSADDQEIIAELREKLSALGLNPDQAEEMFKQGKQPAIRVNEAPEPFSVQPQNQWREARKRLDEQAKRVANLLLNNTDLSRTGRELTHEYKSLKLSGRNNFVSALMMANNEINKRLGKDRQNASTEEFQAVLDQLEDILQLLVRRVKKAQSDYDSKQA